MASDLRAEKPEELDDLIIQMIETPKPVIFDCRVSKLANCFPMIPSGEAHNNMILRRRVLRTRTSPSRSPTPENHGLGFADQVYRVIGHGRDDRGYRKVSCQ